MANSTASRWHGWRDALHTAAFLFLAAALLVSLPAPEDAGRGACGCQSGMSRATLWMAPRSLAAAAPRRPDTGGDGSLRRNPAMTPSPTFSQRRPPAVAGQFYPAAPAELRSMLASFLASPAGAPLPGAVRGVIVPHAGYVYSGATAGAAFARLRARAAEVKRVVVLAPSHHVGFQGISIGDYAEFATPLGAMAVDVEGCARLAQAHPLISTRTDAHRDEHALEVQLPFIQAVLPGAKLVPVVCGQLDRDAFRELGRVLHDELWRPDTVWVASSDFTHYGRAFGYLPFTRDVPRRLKELDEGAIRLICGRDLAGFLAYLDTTGATICGSTPIGLLLAASAGEPVGVVQLAYSTSADLTHDYDHTVSYAAIAVHDAPAGAKAAAPAAAESFVAAEQSFLLTLARDAVDRRLRKEGPPTVDPERLAPALRETRACFVTLTEKGTGSLRGCIGNLEASEPLWRNVLHNAVNAAFHDPRFPPVAAAELPRLQIEISVLTPARPIASLDEFVLGRHGIILSKGRAAAVFLPQVAPEQGWDKETTLTHLALKAGLPPDAWRRGASFEVFEAIVFGEHE
ncbi:MAG: AmmeMemoRadiSam system protein B [Lentisphaeria bacterium]